MVNHCLAANQNEDLAEERRLCPFDTLDLTAKIYGGEKAVKSRQRIQKFVENTPELRDCSHDFSFLSRLETLERTARNTVLLKKYLHQAVDVNDPFEYEYFRRYVTFIFYNYVLYM